MVREVVEIIVRERGARATSRSIRNVGVTSRTAASGVRVLSRAVGALTVLLGASALLRYADSATALTNRLRILTDDSEELEAVQNRLFQIANRTRVPITELASLYGRLGLAARELGVDTETLLDFTEQVGELLAQQGTGAQQARGALLQLGQATGSTIVRAEEFNSILEGALPIAIAAANGLDRAGGSVARLRTLIIDGEVSSREFFNAILSQGEITEEVFDRTEATVSQAFTVLENALIQAVGDIDNAVEGTNTLARGIIALAGNIRTGLVTAFTAFVVGIEASIRAGASFLDLLDDIGVQALPMLDRGVRATLDFIRVLIAGLDVAFSTVLATITGAIFGVNRFGNAIGRISDAEVTIAFNDFDAAGQGLADSIGNATEAWERYASTIRPIVGDGSATAQFADQARDAADAAGELIARLRAIGTGDDISLRGRGPGAGGPSSAAEDAEEAAALLARQESALDNLIRQSQQLFEQELQRTEPLDAQVEALRVQREEIVAAAIAAGDLALAQDDVAAVNDRIAATEAEKARLLGRQESLAGTLAGQIDRLAESSPEFAEQTRQAAAALIAAGGGVEEIVSGLERLGTEARRELEELQEDAERLGEDVGEALATGVGDALRGVLRGEAVDFAEVLADTAASLLDVALNEVLDGLSNSLSSIFNDLTGASSGDAGSGGIGVALGAALGVGLGLIAGALRDDSAEITNGLATSSAVENVQATRGVVAGPTNIPILEIGDSLESALLGTEQRLDRLIEIAQGGGSFAGGPVAGLGSEDEAALANSISPPGLF